jgi:hypothetical protein
VAPGFATFDRGFGIAVYPSHSFTYYRRTHFDLEDGAVVEYRPIGRGVLRLDIGETSIAEFEQVVQKSGSLIVFVPGHVAQHLSMALSAGHVFSRRDEHRSEAEPRGVKEPEVGVLYSLNVKEHLLVQDLEPDSGSGFWGDFGVSRWLLIDGAMFYLPRDDLERDYQDGGQALEAFCGPMIGHRGRTVGVFAKIRPGAVEFMHTVAQEATGPHLSIRFDKFTDIGLDMGGVVEVYPSAHLVVRTDLGVNTIFYRSRSVLVNNHLTNIAGEEQGSILFLTGVGWRF